MAVMLSQTYDALIAAGAPEDKARGAAEELAGYESRFVGVEGALRDLRADIVLLKWMAGVNTTLILLVLGKLFFGR